LHILRLAIQNGDAYGHGTLTSFWDKIGKAFEATTGKKHKTLSRAIDHIVKARRKFLDSDNDSGEQRAQTSYTDAIDEWISIVDSKKELEKARKEAQGEKDRESAVSQAWLNDSMALWTRRNAPASLARKRKRQPSSQATTASNNGDEGPADVNSPPADIEIDSPLIMDQSTPASSYTGDPPAGPPTKRRKTKSQRRSASPEMVADFHRFVDTYIARGARRTDDNSNLGITELRADVNELKDKIGGLEEGINAIKRMLEQGP
jgi:hypothetical protein